MTQHGTLSGTTAAVATFARPVAAEGLLTYPLTEPVQSALMAAMAGLQQVSALHPKYRICCPICLTKHQALSGTSRTTAAAVIFARPAAAEDLLTYSLTEPVCFAMLAATAGSQQVSALHSRCSS